MELLTVSELRCFRACPRRHYYQYVRRLRHASEAAALRFGSLIHRALETWFEVSKHIDPTNAEHRETRLAAAVASLLDGNPDPIDLAKARPLICGYDVRWGTEPFEVLAVEQQFNVPLLNPETGAASRTYSLGGKIDAAIRLNGQELLVEHKTASGDIGPGSGYWERLRIDGQISVYFAGAKGLGLQVDGCLYDVIGKVALRQSKATPLEDRKYTKKGALYAGQRDHDETLEEYESRIVDHVAENPNRYYHRGTVVRLERELEDAAYDTWATARLIREAQVAKRWPRNPDACETYGGWCAYWPICSGSCSEDDSRFVVGEVKHRELEQEKAA